MRTPSLTAVARGLAATAALAFGASAALHTARPDKMAAWARWPRSDHYQREIAIFDAVNAVALIGFCRRADDPRQLVLLSATGLLLGANHYRARALGDTGPVLNPMAVYGDTVAGAAGLVLAALLRRQR